MNTTSKIAIAAAALIAVGALGTTAYAHRQGGGHGGGYGGGDGGGYHGGGHGGGYHRGRRRHGWKGHGKRHGARHLMERYDTNNDKKVTQEEINTNRETWHKDFDANNDGKLTLDEFKQLWMKAKARRIVREFQRFDRDGDAAVSQNEYLKPMVNLVERRDRNGDGALSRADRRRHHKNRNRMMRRDGGREDAEEAPENESNN